MNVVLFGMTLPVYALGLFVLWHIVRPQRRPADRSNRINKVRALWFVLTREDYFAPHYPWMQRDELENVHARDP